MIAPLIREIAYVSNLTSRFGVVALDCPDQAEQPVRDQVAFVHMRRQAAAETAGDELDEGCIGQDEPIAHGAIA